MAPHPDEEKMPPSASKANYKTYEAQARLVRAIVAAHPEVKWNYKEIVACYGSDMTEHALNHRFRRLRAQSVIIREGRKVGLDMKNLIPDGEKLPATQESIDKQDIAKYFGSSTPDGVEFHFRGVKKDAKLLRQVSNEGGDLAGCLNIKAGRNGGGSSVSTPSKPTPARGAGSRSAGGGTGRKRAHPEIKRASSDEEDNDVEEPPNWSDMEATPSKRPRGGATPGAKTPRTPSRRAATKASNTIAEAAVLLDGSDEEDGEGEIDRAQTPTVRRSRIGMDPATDLMTSGRVLATDVAGQSFMSIDQKPAIVGGHAVSVQEAYLGDDLDQRTTSRFAIYDDLGDGEC